VDQDNKVTINKHIVIITPGFPADENDFLTIPPLQEFLKSLTSSFPLLIITVIALHYPYQYKKYGWNGLQIVSMAGKNKKLTKPLLWYKTINTVKKINKSNPVNVIHSLWLGECAMIGNILSKKFNCKHVCTLMGQDVKSSNKYLRLLNKKKITIVALSKNQANQFFNLTKKSTDEIVEWGIDDIPVSNSERDIDLLAVGSLIPLKNYSLYINLVEKVKQKYPDIKCKLAGAGPEELSLRQLAKENGVEKNIEFKGTLSRTEIFKLMQRSKIFIHPSKFEGSGYVFAEALANGLSIVSFNVGYAQLHPKWFIAEDDENLINITLNLLASKLDYSPVNLFPINETVNRYASLYEIN
jgi:glycosyltransferase involved in cell wall biosynthesis